jgi:hypothetical protein
LTKLILTLLLSLISWLFPPIHTVAAQTKASLPEVNIKQVTTPTNESRKIDTADSDTQSSKAKETNRPFAIRPVSTSTSSYSGRYYSKEEVQNLIIQYSQEYGISADLPLRVANCESGYNQFSKNKNSTAAGVAQYLSSTWRNTEAGRAGLSVYDADANIHMMVKSIASGGISNWNASRSCWSK